MAMQRPGRPSTRLNQPAVNAPAPKPALRPGTRVVPKQQAAPAPAPATSRTRSSGSSTRSVAKQSSSRPVPKQAPKSNSTMMIAVGAGVVVVLGIAAFAMSSGGHEKTETIVKKEASKPKVVDVAGLEREGMSKCDQGLSIIKKCESQMQSASLSDPERSRLKSDLEKATALLRDGMGMLDEANRKSGNTYPLQPYIEAKKVARMKLGELGN